MGSHQEAVAAIEALDKKHRFPGSDSAMVAKWVDQQLQQKRPRRASEVSQHGVPAVARLLSARTAPADSLS